MQRDVFFLAWPYAIFFIKNKIYGIFIVYAICFNKSKKNKIK
jgi:hypothetical protein